MLENEIQTTAVVGAIGGDWRTVILRSSTKWELRRNERVIQLCLKMRKCERCMQRAPTALSDYAGGGVSVINYSRLYNIREYCLIVLLCPVFEN